MRGEGEADACGELSDASADLEQSEPQGIELEARDAEASEPASEPANRVHADLRRARLGGISQRPDHEFAGKILF